MLVLSYTLSPSPFLKFGGRVSLNCQVTQAGLKLNHSASVSQCTESTGVHHHTWLMGKILKWKRWCRGLQGQNPGISGPGIIGDRKKTVPDTEGRGLAPIPGSRADGGRGKGTRSQGASHCLQPLYPQPWVTVWVP